MQPHEHWEGIYERKRADEVSWFRPHLDQSLHFIDAAGLSLSDAIIDVGGGASTLVDDLLTRGYTNVTVLDLSARAIESAKERLGDRAARVRWLIADITQVQLPAGAYAFWHDRAVFHFLRGEAERRRYVEAVRTSVRPSGHVLVATFGPDGPTRCSGLEVARYSADELHAQFGGDFQKTGSAAEVHTTPWGAAQPFVYCYCRVAPAR